ncbi:MAG TPA: phosphopantetheine-binding protein, partial [Blastocatellia bacterium]|nr:phosphopantetheine-binding protein [Blastocatellia bacterium]
LPALPSAPLESAEDYASPRTALEEVICGIWTDLLHLQAIGVHDNFFELGGHSLLATQAISRIREAFDIDVPLRTLFESPTVAGMALAIVQKQAERADAELLGEMLDELDRLPEEEVQRILATESGEKPSL